jgi:hypothetical protein
MDSPAPFDPLPCHRFFSADCFNKTWTLLEKASLTAAEEEQMLLLAMASLWHWTQRPDCQRRQLQIGNWMVSRVYAALGQAENASLYAGKCLLLSEGEEPFYLAFAHEAAARAARLGGNGEAVTRHLTEARRLAALVAEDEDRAQLENDLASIA